MYLIAFSEVRDRPEFWSYSNIAVFLLESKASQNKKTHYNKPQKEPKSKFPYYYHAVILPSSLTSKIDSLLCILYNVKLDTSWLWSVSLDWMEKRRNGTERESNFIATITNYMVDLITLKKMTDGKIALSYSGHLWRCDYIDSEKIKISVHICAPSQFIKKSLLQGLHMKEIFFLLFPSNTSVTMHLLSC